jgi:hypothetical protein
VQLLLDNVQLNSVQESTPPPEASEEFKEIRQFDSKHPYAPPPGEKPTPDTPLFFKTEQFTNVPP